MPLQTAVTMMKVVMTSSKQIIDKVSTSSHKHNQGGGALHQII